MYTEKLTTEQAYLKARMLHYRKIARTLNKRSKAYKKYYDLYINTRDKFQNSIRVFDE